MKNIFRLTPLFFLLSVAFADDNVSLNHQYVQLNKQGLEYLEMSEYQAAIEIFNDAVRLNPNLSTAYANLGKVYAQQGKTDEALQNFKKASSLNPNFNPALHEIGKLYIRNGDLQRALDWFTKKFVNPDKETYYYIGKIYSKMGELGKAIDSYSKALILDPDYSEALRDKNTAHAEQAVKDGEFSLNQGSHEIAKERFEIALEFKPDFAKAYNNLGLVYLYQIQEHFYKRKGFLWALDYGRPKEYFDQAANFAPNEASIYSNRGRVFALLAYRGPIPSPFGTETDRKVYKTEAFEHALKDYNKALELNPRLWQALFNRGELYLYRGEFKKAIADYTKALEIADHDKVFELYYNRAEAYFNIGEHGQAISDYTEALKLEPNAETYKKRADAYTLLNQWDKAIADYTTALEFIKTGRLLINMNKMVLLTGSRHDYDRNMYKTVRKTLKRARAQAKRSGSFIARDTTSTIGNRLFRSLCRDGF